jgi:IS5 family transposase
MQARLFMQQSHTKHDHGLQRCWLKGSEGDALHTVLCAAGYNLRWLLRAIARLGIAAVFLRLHFLLALAVGWQAGYAKPPQGTASD